MKDEAQELLDRYEVRKRIEKMESVTRDDFRKMSFDERVELHKQKPDLYNKVSY